MVLFARLQYFSAIEGLSGVGNITRGVERINHTLHGAGWRVTGDHSFQSGLLPQSESPAANFSFLF